MTLPVRCYLYEDSVLPSASVHHSYDTGSTIANLTDERSGKLMELGSSFIIRSGVNDQIRVENDDTGDTVAITLTSLLGGYGGDLWAAQLANVVNDAFDGAGYTPPVMLGSYSETTRKFTLSSAANTIIHWDWTSRSQQLALDMGYPAVATASGTSHVSTSETFVKDRQYIVWDLGGGLSDPEAIMFFASNLSSTDTFYLYGNDTDLGTNPYDWADSALYRTNNTIQATRSELHDLYVWLPTIDGLHYAARYWMLSWTRGGSQAAMPNAKIGVGGIWTEAWFDANDFTTEVNYLTPWQRRPLTGDVTTKAPAGGGVHLHQSRGGVQVQLPFEDWPDSIYRVFEAYWDRNGMKSGLWIPDADNLYPTTGYPTDALFGRISQWQGASIDGPNDDRTFSITLDGEPMPPVGAI